MQERVELALALDDFTEAYDPYDYKDCVDDKSLSILKTLCVILEGETQGIIAWLKQIIDEDGGTDDCEAARMLLLKMEEIVTFD